MPPSKKMRAEMSCNPVPVARPETARVPRNGRLKVLFPKTHLYTIFFVENLTFQAPGPVSRPPGRETTSILTKFHAKQTSGRTTTTTRSCRHPSPPLLRRESNNPFLPSLRYLYMCIYIYIHVYITKGDPFIKLYF